MSKHAVTAVAFAFGLLILPGVPLNAATGIDLITIGNITVGSCGEQSLTFQGTAEYSEPTQHLVVDLDGVQLLHDEDEPITWTTSPVTVNVGSHTLVATIYDKSDHVDVVVRETVGFSVASCGAPASTSPSGGAGESHDCCPGPDPVQPKPKPVTKGQVKAAVEYPATLPMQLKPLNEIFRKVYGRSPTLEEWNYWAGRLLNDKPQYDALYGAMQWHELRGRSTGDPVPMTP